MNDYVEIYLSVGRDILVDQNYSLSGRTRISRAYAAVWNGNISKLGILKKNPTQPGCTSRCSKHPLQAGRWEQVHADGSCQCSVSLVLHIYT